jgi:oligoribonuclease NrnB/cAMP/cGMP phosphodiesterase (DHH superfamily)
MILSLSHNDLDAVGCQLCIHEKFSKIKNIDYYNTNYKNLEELVHDIEDRIKAQREDIKLLMITDISFSEVPELLNSLKLTCSEHSIPVIYVDHHMYPDGFFDGLETADFKVHHDKEICGAMGTYKALKLDNSNLLKIIKVIDVFDIWRDESPIFPLANDLNNYFWASGRMQIMQRLIDRNYGLPHDFVQVCTLYKEQAEEFYQKALKKNTIFSPSAGISCAFIDDYFNYIVERELQSKKVFICASSFGALRIRFSKTGFSPDVVLEIKERMLKGLTRGHLWSFSMQVDVTSNLTIIEKFKEIHSIIIEVENNRTSKELNGKDC